MKRFILALVASSLLLIGCGTKEYNDAVLKSNVDARSAYAQGMAACKDNAACQVGLSAAYFGNAGQMPLAKPDTALDYAKGLFPFAQLFVQWDASGSGTGQGVSFKNVKFGRDTVISGFNATKTITTSEANNNRTYTMTPTGGTGGASDQGMTFIEPSPVVTQ